MRSVVVVLPASICAMIPMFRTLARSAAVWVATLSVLSASSWVLPAVVREGLVGLRHLVGVLTALDAGAKAVAGVEQLVHQPLGHRLLPALARVQDDPAQGQGGAAGGAHLHRNLVGGTADAAAADLKGRLDVVQRALERDHRVVAVLLAAALKRPVHGALGERALAVLEDLVGERGHQRRAVHRVGNQLPLLRGTLTRHLSS